MNLRQHLRAGAAMALCLPLLLGAVAPACTDTSAGLRLTPTAEGDILGGELQLCDALVPLGGASLSPAAGAVATLAAPVACQGQEAALKGLLDKVTALASTSPTRGRGPPRRRCPARRRTPCSRPRAGPTPSSSARARWAPWPTPASPGSAIRRPCRRRSRRCPHPCSPSSTREPADGRPALPRLVLGAGAPAPPAGHRWPPRPDWYDLSPAVTKTAKTACIGHSVCPQVAEAIVVTNLGGPPPQQRLFGRA